MLDINGLFLVIDRLNAERSRFDPGVNILGDKKNAATRLLEGERGEEDSIVRFVRR